MVNGASFGAHIIGYYEAKREVLGMSPGALLCREFARRLRGCLETLKRRGANDLGHRQKYHAQIGLLVESAYDAAALQ
jgi:hypothetical protein